MNADERAQWIATRHPQTWRHALVCVVCRMRIPGAYRAWLWKFRFHRRFMERALPCGCTAYRLGRKRGSACAITRDCLKSVFIDKSHADGSPA